MKKIYVLDTSVLLTDPNSIFSFGDNDVVIPLKVLDELDGQKKRQDTVGLNARTVIRSLDKLIENGSLAAGVKLGPKMGTLKVLTANIRNLPEEWDRKLPDNIIISTVLRNTWNDKKNVILVTKDINVRVKCNSISILTEDYKKEKVIKDTDDLYNGMTEITRSDQFIEKLFSKNDVFFDDTENFTPHSEKFLYPNQYINFKSELNSKKNALCRFVDYNNPLVLLKNSKKKKNHVLNLSARNQEQVFALDLLLNPNIPVVSLIGIAGTGKTLLALAAGLQQVTEDQQYGKLIVSRPVVPLGKEIGFLPGTLEDKMGPWLMPVKDNLEFLAQMNNRTFEEYMRDGTIEIEALTYIRGRSIANAFIIIDECQQLTQHEVKTILTRVGPGTKIVLTGDVNQIDNLYVDETSNGLTYAVEKFKQHSIAGHITLKKGERSAVATLSAKIL